LPLLTLVEMAVMLRALRLARLVLLVQSQPLQLCLGRVVAFTTYLQVKLALSAALRLPPLP
jgi:hypothetical protein